MAELNYENLPTDELLLRIRQMGADRSDIATSSAEINTMLQILEQRSAAKGPNDLLWPVAPDDPEYAEQRDSSMRAMRACRAISDALASAQAPTALIPRYLLQESPKPQKDPEKRPEQSSEYEDWITKRMARTIYKLSVDTQRTAPTDTQAAPPTEAKAPMEDTCSTRLSADDPQLQLNWEDVALCFIGDHRVMIRAGGRTQTLHYKQIEGCENKNSGLPTEQWSLLRTLVKTNGLIPDQARHGAEWQTIQKRIERTRKVLRDHLGMTGDPIPYHKGVGYRARFTVTAKD